MTNEKSHTHLGYLLLSLLLSMLLYPFFEKGIKSRFLLNLAFSLILIAGLYTLRTSKKSFYFGVALATLNMVANLFLFSGGNPYADAVYRVSAIMFYAFIVHSLLKYILASNQIDNDVLYGAVCVYLLIGIMWGVLYYLLETVSPGSFQINQNSEGTLQTHMLYFSFVTLTTTGYGDIVPLTAMAHSLSVLESVTGVMYIAIMISRLISAFNAHSPTGRK